jgi:hypothetical protein
MKQKCVSRTAHVFTAVNRVVIGPKSSVSDTCPHDQCLVVSPHKLKLKTQQVSETLYFAPCVTRPIARGVLSEKFHLLT